MATNIVLLTTETDKRDQNPLIDLTKRFARTNVLKNSFFHRIVDRWNILSFEIRCASSVHIFNFKVITFLLKCK